MQCFRSSELLPTRLPVSGEVEGIKRRVVLILGLIEILPQHLPLSSDFHLSYSVCM